MFFNFFLVVLKSFQRHNTTARMIEGDHDAEIRAEEAKPDDGGKRARRATRFRFAARPKINEKYVVCSYHDVYHSD